MTARIGSTGPALVTADELEEYEFGPEDRLDSHHFVTWERRRWLNSDMGLNATPECRALYFDLICHSYDQSPIGTLPTEMGTLARLVRCDRAQFEALCALRLGPLHKWVPCRCGDEIRLMHHMVVSTLRDSFARREDNRARTEAASREKRLRRLRVTLASIDRPLSENDHAVLWIADRAEERDIRSWKASTLHGIVQEWITYSTGAPMRR